ncbi:MAG: hypothetical protein M3P52_05015 [Actinomycetota bacterium]|nr:hypothetical protein [Actinomycetota bacterium]
MDEPETPIASTLRDRMIEMFETEGFGYWNSHDATDAVLDMPEIKRALAIVALLDTEVPTRCDALNARLTS